jgi:hypothetical protein
MGSAETDWLQELDHPSAGFFRTFAARCRAGNADAPAQLAREAILRLVPAVDWAAYLPHTPHGLLGLQAVLRLRPLLGERSFLRLLATQVHAFAHDRRAPAGHELGAIGKGSGNWANLHMALGHHRPAIAWGEAAAVEPVLREHFLILEVWAEADMANVGHKSVLARSLGELYDFLGQPADPGRLLLAMAAWHCASEPFDTFWHDRAASRLGEVRPVPFRAADQEPARHRQLARELCDAGLVELLDRSSEWVRSGLGSGDLLAVLALAAAEKLLDARRDLEGKTAWNLAVLATLAKRAAEEGQSTPESWVQAAALVNLFPTGEEADRPLPKAPRQAPADLAMGLLDAILDGEPEVAMSLAAGLLAQAGPEAVLKALAEAAADNDPVFNYSHQVLAVAAAADLCGHLPEHAREAVLVALAKSLANAQGSADLGRLADKALDSVAAG